MPFDSFVYRVLEVQSVSHRFYGLLVAARSGDYYRVILKNVAGNVCVVGDVIDFFNRKVDCIYYPALPTTRLLVIRSFVIRSTKMRTVRGPNAAN